MTPEHSRLLSFLMEATSERPVIRALLKSGVGDEAQLVSLALSIEATVEGKTDVDTLSEQDARDVARTFLMDNRVRLAIADSVARTHEGVTYEQAKADLGDLLRELGG